MSDAIGTVEQLVAARQARGITAEDMIRQLKLHPRQLDALERGDWKALPGLPFVRGTIRNYGKVLGVDVDPLLESVGGFAKPSDLRSTASLETPMPASGMFGFGSGGSGSGFSWILLVVVGLVALALFFGRNGDLSGVSSWLGAKTERPAGEPASPSSTEGGRTESVPIPGQTSSGAPDSGAQGATASSAVPSPAAGTGAAPAVAGQDAALAAPTPSAAAAPAASTEPAKVAAVRLKFDADSWVDIRADGKVLLLGTQKGQTISEVDAPPGTPLSLVIGNAEKVKLEFRGKPVPLKVQPGTGIAKVTLQ